MLTGYTANLPSDVLLDTGVLYVGSTVVGATRGAPQFNPNREVENVEFDGKHAPLKGLDRPFHGEPEISGTLIEFGDAATGNQIGKLEPGASSATAGGAGVSVTTITPAPGGAFMASGSYLTDVRLVFERGIGTGTKKYAVIYFPCGFVKQWGPLQGAAKGEATVPFTIVGRKDPAAGSLADAAYKIELREALP